MDLGMPFAQREAWNKLKKAVNDYAGATGNEIAVATTYLTTSSTQTVDNAPVAASVSGQSLAFYGHGDLLQRVRESLDMIKNRSLSRNKVPSSISNGWSSTKSTEIPIKQSDGNGDQTHYTQSMARSLCSSFRSLKLDQRGNPGFMSEMNSAAVIGIGEGHPAANSSPINTARHGNKRSSRKKSSRRVNGEQRDSLEFDENLLFDEPSYGTSGDENDEDDEFDSDDDSTDLSENSFGRHSNFPPSRTVQRPPPVVQADPNQFATSLPVNININWGRKSDGAPRFRDNQGPHPPLHLPPKQTLQAPRVVNQSSRPVIQSSQFQDTPNPETMMASMQALARSVTDDSALIFGERPRPRLNTGESRLTRVRR